jgi:hypothetical protein
MRNLGSAAAPVTTRARQAVIAKKCRVGRLRRITALSGSGGSTAPGLSLLGTRLLGLPRCSQGSQTFRLLLPRRALGLDNFARNRSGAVHLFPLFALGRHNLFVRHGRCARRSAGSRRGWCSSLSTCCISTARICDSGHSSSGGNGCRTCGRRLRRCDPVQPSCRGPGRRVLPRSRSSAWRAWYRSAPTSPIAAARVHRGGTRLHAIAIALIRL